MEHKHGFTLIELLVVTAIMGVLASIIIASTNQARQRARAIHLVGNLDNIAKAWALWQADTGSYFPNEKIYGNVNIEAPCNDEPVLSSTDLFQNISGIPSWNGPYMRAIPRDPWGREYSYDNDEDMWDPPNVKWGGVNIQAQWCLGEAGRYLELAPIIDEIYDKGDGSNFGRFRWNASSQGGYGILITPFYRN